MDHTEDFLPARDFQSVEIQNRILKKSVYHVRFVEKMWFFERQKKEENTADILAYMESRRQAVCDIIEVGLSVLPEKIQNARSAAEVTTALGTLIDKFTAFGGGPGNDAKEDGLSQSLRELAEGLESDEN